MNAFSSVLLFLSDHPWLFALAKGSVMLALTGVAFAVAAKLRFPAAARHAVLLTGCILALIVPLLALAPAMWRVGVPVEAQVEVMTPKPQAMPMIQPEAQVEPKPVALPVVAAVQPVQVAPVAPAWQLPSTMQLALWLWLLGAAAVLMPLVVAYLRLTVQAARARKDVRPEWSAWLAEESVRAGLRHSVALCVLPTTGLAPATFGFSRWSRIVLPQEAHDWPEHDLRLVLAHELAHVRRCDWLARLAAQVMLALYWFNPLAWWAASRMGAEAEFACDAQVVAGGARASAYAQCMVDMVARMRGAGGGCMAPAMPFGSFLSRRIVRVLETSKNSRSLGRVWSLALMLGAAAGAVGVGCAGVEGREKAQVAPVAAAQAKEKTKEKTEQKTPAIIEAARQGDAEEVKRLLATGARVDEPDTRNLQAIHWAALMGRTEVVRLLLAAGAKVDAVGWHGFQPIHEATRDGQMETVKLLLAAGARVDAANPEDGTQPIHCAASFGQAEMVRFLLFAGAKADACSFRGAQPIHGAAMIADIPTAKILLAAGAKIDATTHDGQQPMHYAAVGQASAGKIKTREDGRFLSLGGFWMGLPWVDGVEDSSGKRDIAIEQAHLEMVRFLLASGAKVDAETVRISDQDRAVEKNKNIMGHLAPGQQPIEFAAATGYAQVVKLMLDSGAKVDAGAGSGSGLPLIAAAAGGDVETIRVLLAAGAKVDGARKFGGQAIHRAAVCGRLEAVKFLLASGAKADARDAYGQQPLHEAASTYRIEVAKVLLAAGAKVDAVDNEGRQPLHCAVEGEYWEIPQQLEMAKFLVAAGAKIGAKTKEGLTPLEIVKKRADHADCKELAKYLEEQEAKAAQVAPPAKANVTEAEKQQLELTSALLGGNVAKVKDLLAHGAKADMPDLLGNSPMDTAASWNKRELVEVLRAAGAKVTRHHQFLLAVQNGPVEEVKRHLAAGEKVDAVDAGGWQPIHRAVSAAQPEVVKLLLASGAKVDAVASNGSQPICMVEPKSPARVEVFKILLAAGASVDAENKQEQIVMTCEGVGQLTWRQDANHAFGLRPIHSYAQYGDIEIVKHFIAAGAKLDIPGNDEGSCPIHLAAANGRTEVVRALIAAGAKVNIQDKAGNLPSYWAKKGGHQELAKYLEAQETRAAQVAPQPAKN